MPNDIDISASRERKRPEKAAGFYSLLWSLTLPARKENSSFDILSSFVIRHSSVRRSFPGRSVSSAGIALGHFQVMGTDHARALQLIGSNGAHDLAGNAHDDGARRNAAVLGDHSAGGNQTFLADLAARQEPGADAHQRIRADTAALPERPRPHHPPLLQFLLGGGVRAPACTVSGT